MMARTLVDSTRVDTLLVIDADAALSQLGALGVKPNRTMGQIREEIIRTAQNPGRAGACCPKPAGGRIRQELLLWDGEHCAVSGLCSVRGHSGKSQSSSPGNLLRRQPLPLDSAPNGNICGQVSTNN